MRPASYRFLAAVLRPLLLIAVAAGSASAEPRALDDAAWRADIEAAAAHIVEHHPKPFSHISRDAFTARVETLLTEVPDLTDKEILLRLAEIVGSIRDGHTRLTIPRRHPQLGLFMGHSSDTGPESEALVFEQLPIAFERFSDGVYITQAASSHANLIGRRLVAIDGVPVADALERTKPITYADNDQLGTLMAVDRLALPEALFHLGIGNTPERMTLTLNDPQGAAREVELRPLPAGTVEWRTAFDADSAPLHARNPERMFWSEYLPDENAVYVQLDEIANGEEVTLAEFVMASVRLAKDRDARLVIDIRRNFGGSGGLNRTLVLALIQNPELNRYGRTLVLTGPRTFSAAQMLVNELEQYTRAVLIGEPTGSPPDHFGDPAKIRLEHSGLTLRVSRLHWSSYTAFDEREATLPDIVAEWTAEAYFSAGDPALQTALALEDVTLESLLRAAFTRGDLQQVGRHALYATRAPDSHDQDIATLLLNLGNEFRAADDVETASLAYRVGLYLYPDHADLANALAALTGSQS